MGNAYPVVEDHVNVMPFWRRIPRFFLYPFHLQPLLHLLLFSALSTLASLNFLFLVLVTLGLMVAVLRHAFQIMEQTTQGYLKPDEYQAGDEAERDNLPYKLLGVMLVWTVVVVLVNSLSETAGTILDFFVTMAVPASIMALSVSNSFFLALNPMLWVHIMRTLGWAYVVLWVFLYLLSQGMVLVWLPVVELVETPWLVFPLLACIAIYFIFIMFNMMGYCLYQYHRELGLSVRVPFDQTDARMPDGGQEGSSSGERDVVGEQIAARVAEGDLKTALELAYEQQQQAPDNIAVQDRYHKLLLLRNKPSATLSHARRFISLLLSRDQGRRALEVLQACREIEADFAPTSGDEVFKLAQQARRSGAYTLMLKLVRGFDTRFPGHPAIPEVYFLSAEVLSEQFGKDEMAIQILQILLQRFPDHALHTQASHRLRRLMRLNTGGDKRPAQTPNTV